MAITKERLETKTLHHSIVCKCYWCRALIQLKNSRRAREERALDKRMGGSET